ncbi:serine/threonine protein kinase [Planoprotostelium fungivorum]|uniref:non-specific serine/threonine protein kinase n=1 Tax=Planoprotostelium fungivorum TaxID=1890364 RepID=A0A2P6NFV3_9EUKA|nr:serine/threonine protein kinase [Planoprotostelium fungivorum]
MAQLPPATAATTAPMNPPVSLIRKVQTSAESFDKIALIGRGDVGKVYLVKHKESGKYFAMKVLDKHEMIERNKIKRVHTEREILSTADHPFIVTLHWSFQSQSHLYFVMECCQGGEFFRMLQKQPGRCLKEDDVRFYAAEVLLALEYLHMKGFIYRDLKPENILLHQTGHVMLTDFDLSKQAPGAATAQVIKKMFEKPEIYSVPELGTNSLVGTAEYLAPEVIQGYGQSSSVDWWTFGILIYEMLFGHTPYKGKSQDDTFNHILDGELKFPDHPYHPVGSNTKSLIKKLLHADPKKRLGAQHGSTDIKKHKFFDGKINFTLIRNLHPPMIPKINGPEDTSNFRVIKDDIPEDNTVRENEQDAFKDFVPINPRTEKNRS